MGGEKALFNELMRMLRYLYFLDHPHPIMPALLVKPTT